MASSNNLEHNGLPKEGEISSKSPKLSKLKNYMNMQ